MSRYLDVVNRVAEAHAHAKTAKTAKSGLRLEQISQNSQFSRSQGLLRTLAVLKSRCPRHIDITDWKTAIEDGSTFLSRWVEQAAALGWSSWDLFGLAPIPGQRAETFRRLSRYDMTGLIWILRGRSVVALTENIAAVQSSVGTVTRYRKNSKPAVGPAGRRVDGI